MPIVTTANKYLLAVMTRFLSTTKFQFLDSKISTTHCFGHSTHQTTQMFNTNYFGDFLNPQKQRHQRTLFNVDIFRYSTITFGEL